MKSTGKKAGKITRAETRRQVQEQKAPEGQARYQEICPEKSAGRVVYNTTAIWQRVSEEELVKRANWGEQVSLMIWIRRGRQACREGW